MDNRQQAGCGGISFFGAMFLIFMTLKLCGIINWSWWWVTAPLWGPPVVLVTLIVGAFFVILAFYIIMGIVKRKRG